MDRHSGRESSRHALGRRRGRRPDLLTYAELHREVNRLRQCAARARHQAKATSSALYMPMMPEIVDRAARNREDRRHRPAAVLRLRRRCAQHRGWPMPKRKRFSPPTDFTVAARSSHEASGRRGIGRVPSLATCRSFCGVWARTIRMVPGRDHWWHELSHAAAACRDRTHRRRRSVDDHLHLGHDGQPERRGPHALRISRSRPRRTWRTASTCSRPTRSTG